MSERSAGSSDPLATPPVVEQWIIEYLRKEFPRVELGPDTSFNTIGLDSMVAVELTGFLERQLRRTVSPTLVYEFDTPREVATALAQSFGSPIEESP